MANRAHSRRENVPGALFVDDTCIDCDTCRAMAPATFDRAGSMSRVRAQPANETERRAALLALVACPTASIGTSNKTGVKDASAAFPVVVEEPVFHCGYHDESSYGAWSWFIRRAQGNVLVDVPRFAGPLVRRIEELGGVHTIFLTHRDDVADHARWAAHFNATRVMHADDLSQGTRAVERQVVGSADVALDTDLVVIPTPGHTRGSACLLFGDRFLFTGDHLSGDDDGHALVTFDDVCWYSLEAQRASVRKLAAYTFERVLPGHGRRLRATRAHMRELVVRAGA